MIYEFSTRGRFILQESIEVSYEMTTRVITNHEIATSTDEAFKAFLEDFKKENQ